MEAENQYSRHGGRHRAQNAKRASLIQNHWDTLMDENLTISQNFILFLLLIDCLLFTFPANVQDKYAMDYFVISPGVVYILIGILAICPLVIIALMVVIMVRERRIKDCIDGSSKATIVASTVYTVYKYLFRLHVLLTEPLLTGYLISEVFPYKPEFEFGQIIPQNIKYCLIPCAVLGIILSLLHYFLTETILPYHGITSASNNYVLASYIFGLRTHDSL
jgi:hypothetical protein